MRKDRKKNRRKGGKEDKKDIRTKYRGMVGKKREMKSKKKNDFAVSILGTFQIGHRKAFQINGTIYTPG